MCIVTGPNIDLATKLIKRLKAIFSNKLGIYFTNKETILELNGCMIEAYPSNHLDSFRSLTNPKFIFLDEADMFRKGEQAKKFDKLIISLRTAYANEYSLDKEQTSYSDFLDALGLACKMYKMH